jgi:hypothetical protein
VPQAGPRTFWGEQQDTIYISIRFATVGHKCCCGCGREVITPLSPTDWSLTSDGETVSLHPSIGNWSSKPYRTTAFAPIFLTKDCCTVAF